jgi:hypothetical protein
VSGNALRLDWLSICPPTGTGVKVVSDDLFNTPLDQKEIDFENEGGETYICGNPPYLGSVYQSEDQKSDLEAVFQRHTKDWKSLDYVAGWFQKAAEYGSKNKHVTSAFVSTNSICQGEQVPILWPIIFQSNHQIIFAYRSFKWSNLASNKAGVTVVVVGISTISQQKRSLRHHLRQSLSLQTGEAESTCACQNGQFHPTCVAQAVPQNRPKQRTQFLTNKLKHQLANANYVKNAIFGNKAYL